jgi:hypothetical protein
MRTFNRYRAVFTNSHGEEQTTLRAALQDTPERAEETQEDLIGIEIREVTEWRAVPLAEVMKAMPRD